MIIRTISCYKKFCDRFIRSSYPLVRSLFGQRNVCIFVVGCDNYAYYQLRHHVLPLALLKIGVRLLACNPLTALVRYYYNRYTKRSAKQ